MGNTKANPAVGAFAVTPSDSTVIAARALYVGVSGDVAVICKGGSAAVTFVGHPVGYMPVEVTKVMSTGTTATDIVALT